MTTGRINQVCTQSSLRHRSSNRLPRLPNGCWIIIITCLERKCSCKAPCLTSVPFQLAVRNSYTVQHICGYAIRKSSEAQLHYASQVAGPIQPCNRLLNLSPTVCNSVTSSANRSCWFRAWNKKQGPPCFRGECRFSGRARFWACENDENGFWDSDSVCYFSYEFRK